MLNAAKAEQHEEKRESCEKREREMTRDSRAPSWSNAARAWFGALSFSRIATVTMLLSPFV